MDYGVEMLKAELYGLPKLSNFQLNIQPSASNLKRKRANSEMSAPSQIHVANSFLIIRIISHRPQILIGEKRKVYSTDKAKKYLRLVHKVCTPLCYASPVAFSSFFIIEKMNIAEIEQQATSTPQTIHNGIGPHR